MRVPKKRIVYRDETSSDDEPTVAVVKRRKAKPQVFYEVI
jgi:hypothetical protein